MQSTSPITRRIRTSKPARRRIRPGPALLLAGELGGAAFVTAELIQLARTWPVLLIAAGIGVAGIAAGWAVLRHTFHLGMAAVITSWTGALALWLALACGHGPWHTRPVTILAAVSAAGALAWAEAEADHRHAKAAVIGEKRAKVPDAAAAEFEDLLAKRGAADCTVTDISFRDGLRRIVFAVPDTGAVTYDSLVHQTANIAAARRLTGDAVYFEKGRHDGEVILYLMERNVLAEARPFPATAQILDGRHALSIWDLLPVGLNLDGGWATIRLKETGWKVTGTPGAGKSDFLNVMIALIAMCEDAFPLLIDPKWRLASPWIRPWIEGQTDWPVIEWVANTRDEIGRMVYALDDYLEMSMQSGRGGSKARPSPDNPMPVLIGDECADWMGTISLEDQGAVKQSDLIYKMEKITRKCRSEAVTAILARQRGTITHAGPNNIWQMLRGSVAMGTADPNDARLITPSMAAAKLLGNLNDPGVMVINAPYQRKPAPVGAFLLDPAEDEPHGAACLERITELAIEWGKNGVRPRPSPLMLQAWEKHGFAARWERSPLYKQILETSPAAQATVLAELGDKRDADQARLDQAMANVTSEAARLISTVEELKPLGSKTERARAQLWAWWSDRPYSTMGMGVAEADNKLRLEAGIEVSRKTLHAWFNQWMADGKLYRCGPEGQEGVKYIPVKR